MRVAALYDIHGNLPALEAVLAEVSRERVDLVVVGGDIVPGPMPRETLELLLSLDAPARFLRGNCETDALTELAGRAAERVPAPFREAVRWSARELRDYEALLATWPPTLRLELGDAGAALFCHATPRDDNEIFTRLTPDERLLPIFSRLDAPLVVCGHTHMQFDRAVGPVRVVNAGSVGMPFGEPGAYWLLLDTEVRLRRTAYDLDAAAERIRRTAYPQAADFAARHVLRPPSERRMLEAFSRASL